MDLAEQVATKALVAAADSSATITIEVNPFVAFGIIAQLQLALRHPGNEGPIVELANQVIDALAEQLPVECHPIIARGFDPAHDEQAVPKLWVPS